jgi:glycosyltransferase involved in cell wall biosynthesis
MGEMPLYYALAHAGLLGGSFERLGGQNLIEAAACGCPMLLGPHTFNFAEAAEQACNAGAALRVEDMAAAVQQATALVQNGTQLAAMQQQAWPLPPPTAALPRPRPRPCWRWPGLRRAGLKVHTGRCARCTAFLMG